MSRTKMRNIRRSSGEMSKSDIRIAVSIAANKARKVIAAHKQASSERPLDGQIFCIACGVEVDPQKRLDRQERAKVRKCRSCHGTRLAANAPRHCRVCGKQENKEDVVTHSWSSWSTHDDCKKAVRRAASERDRQTIAAAWKEIERDLLASADPRVAAGVRKKLNMP